MSLYRAIREGRPVGSWIVEWDRVPVGQIRRATGETERRQAQQYEAMLDALAEKERWDILKSIQSGEARIRAVFPLWQKGDLKAIPNATALRRLDAVLEGWAKDARSQHTGQGRRHVGRRLLTMQKDATLNDLPALVTLLRGRLMGQPRSFNSILMTSRALVRDLCGERAALYETLALIRPLPYTAKRVHPFSRSEAREIMDWLGPVRGRMLWTLCLSGMRPGEYFRRNGWEVDGPLIRVHGTKTKGSERVVPLVEQPAEPECSYAGFRQHLAKYPGGRVRVYRARHTFAHWCERARIPMTRIRLYLGHSSRTITDDYTWHEVQSFVKRDAERLRKFLGEGRLTVKRGVA